MLVARKLPICLQLFAALLKLTHLTDILATPLLANYYIKYVTWSTPTSIYNSCVYRGSPQCWYLLTSVYKSHKYASCVLSLFWIRIASLRHFWRGVGISGQLLWRVYVSLQPPYYAAGSARCRLWCGTIIPFVIIKAFISVQDSISKTLNDKCAFADTCQINMSSDLLMYQIIGCARKYPHPHHFII